MFNLGKVQYRRFRLKKVENRNLFKKENKKGKNGSHKPKYLLCIGAYNKNNLIFVLNINVIINNV